jgi:hypothetical protein
MLQRKEGEFDALELTHQNIQLQLTDLNGLQLDVGINSYTPTIIQQAIAGTWEATFQQVLTQRTNGIAPLYLEMTVQGSRSTNEDLRTQSSPITNDENEVCYLAQVTVPDPQERLDLALLHSDEYGDTQWILPVESFLLGDDQRQFVFLVPRPDGAVPNDQPGRFGNPGKQMLRIIAWNNNLPEDHFDAKETPRKNYQLYHVRRREPGDWVFETVPQRSSDFWSGFNRQHGPTLLMIHGTYGTASHAFYDLVRDKAIMEKLHQKYGDRILAFNHPTIGKGVKHNVKRLKKYLNRAQPVPIQLDMLTRSRGALVARYLLEKDQLPDHIHINGDNRLVMFAAPNQGTPTAESKNWLPTLRLNNWINALTAKNRMTLNDNSRQEILYEINYIKAQLQEAHKGMLDKLPIFQGIIDQQPKSKFLKELNDPQARPLPNGRLPKYFVVGAVFNPADDQVELGKHRRKQLVKTLQRVFDGQANDGIVPTESTLMNQSGLPKSPNFHLPADHIRIFQDAPHIHHNNFPTHQAIRKAILEFLL